MPSREPGAPAGAARGPADREALAAVLRRALLELWPGRIEEHALTDEASLGEDGIGLDSIDIAEFLLLAEAQLGGRPTDVLLEQGPVTFGAVVDHFVGC